MTDITRRNWIGGWLAVAAPGSRSALEIVQEAYRRSESSSVRYQGVLTTTNAGGRKTVRRWRVERICRYGAGKVRIRFLDPPDVRGVALLIVNRPDGPADQWMWVPAVARSRRVGLQDRSTRFFGTDFSFEDLEERPPDREQHRLLGEEVVEGARCWRIEAKPRNARESQYSHWVYSIRMDSYAFWQVDKYEGSVLARVLRDRELETIQGILTARQVEMRDPRRGSRTTLAIGAIEYNLPLKESAFLPSSLAEEP